MGYTVAGQGLPGFRSITWFAIAGPPGLPASLADKINRDVDEIPRKPEIVARLQSLQLEPMGGTPADAAKFIAEETRLWSKVIKESHITLQQHRDSAAHPEATSFVVPALIAGTRFFGSTAGD